MLLFNGRAELCLPIQIQAHKVGLRQRPVTALVVKQGLLHQCRELRDRGFSEGGNGFKGAALFGATDGQLRFFRHGSNQPFTTTASSGALPGLPRFALSPKKHSPLRQP